MASKFLLTDRHMKDNLREDYEKVKANISQQTVISMKEILRPMSFVDKES